MDLPREARIRRSRHRKRSMQACLVCRSRKVRCDVDSRGQPCTNCGLDDKDCVIVSQTSKSHADPTRRFHPPESTRASYQQQQASSDQQDTNAASLGKVTPLAEFGVLAEDSELMAFDIPWELDLDMLPTGDVFGRNALEAIDQSIVPPAYFETTRGAHSMGTASPAQRLRDSSQPSVRSNQEPPFQRSRHSDQSATVLYSNYRYLIVGNLHNIPHQDVNYLEAQGCLHVPTRPILDNFVEEYFANFHILLPLLDEGDFWDMYAQKNDSGSDAKMSLLVFNAMLFASCNFVPLEVVEKLGFSDLRTARAEFYRRTKLLYDLETETTPLPLAQSALLLMGWVPPTNATLNPYKTWLGRAIQHARSLNADRHAETVEMPTASNQAERKYHNSLRRLWWCCVILDRISPLCTRYNLHITHDRFDFKNSPPLGIADLQDEIYRSSVFNPATKRRLAALFSIFLEFVLILTDVLTLTFPFEDSVNSPQSPPEDCEANSAKCDDLLKDWYKRAAAQFPPYEDGDKSQLGKIREGVRPVILYTNLMYIYYHTATIALGNYKILRQSVAASNQTTTEWDDVWQSAQLEPSRRELQDSMLEVTKCFEFLTRCRLTRWLPISALACIATPLALHVISARLSSLAQELGCDQQSNKTDSTPASNQHRLNVLTKAMTAFAPQYYGVEWINETARHVANLAQMDRESMRQAGQTTVTDWSQILSSQPGTYLKMTWTVDLCISKGRLPEEHDFPAWLVRQLALAKTAKPNSNLRQQQHHLRSVTASTVVDGSINDMEMFLNMNPQAVEF